MVERDLDQQQGRCRLEPNHVVKVQRVLAQPSDKPGKAVCELFERRTAELLAQFPELGDMRLEAGQCRGLAVAEFVPGPFGRNHFLMQRLEQGGERYVGDRTAGSGDQCFQLPSLADLLQQWPAGTCLRDPVEGFAQQTLGWRAHATLLLPQVLVIAGAQLAYHRVGRQASLCQYFEETLCGPPQRGAGVVFLQGLGLAGGIPHQRRPLRFCRCFQPAQQPTLEAGAGTSQAEAPGVVVEFRAFVLDRRPDAEIRMKEVGRVGRGVATGLLDAPVEIGEPQGLIGCAAGDVFKVVANRRKATLAQCGGGFGSGGLLVARERTEKPFHRVGELGQAAQSDNGQRAAGLVQMCLCKLDVGDGFAGGGGLAEGILRARKRLVDLALDPGERARIQFGGLHHGNVLPPPCGFRP